MFEFALQARDRGIEIIIAGAGGAAHLPGMVASMTSLPVIGVPIETKALKGLDSLLSIAQMPAGVPVSCMAIGGAVNAALQAVKILSINDVRLAQRLDAHRANLRSKVRKMKLR
jgi:phosphoribosylaminoimidazole carboxylase PurE protein